VSAVTESGRPALSTPQGGKIIVDPAVLGLWRGADGQTLAELEASPALPNLRASLACLCQAGLLARTEEGIASAAPTPPPPPEGRGVSAVIVGHNSQAWLEECFASLAAQTCLPQEIIFVDNASSDGSAAWLKAQYPHARLLRCEALVPLARAINLGVAQATGDYFLILNPDLRLEPDALAHLLAAAQAHPLAVVAPKLRLWWAPAFINGLGNSVSAWRWGADTALGHLDLGQFDAWEELPSACFAAALISRTAWEQTGPLDEAFEMYYEDVEWCYRARLLGLPIWLAPRAVIYHALGSRVGSQASQGLAPRKQGNVSYGQLRFSAKLLDRAFPRFLATSLVRDTYGLLRAALRLNRSGISARLSAWRAFLPEMAALRRQRRLLQPRCRLTDRDLFALQQDHPQPLVWRGLPELTSDLIAQVYAPLLLSRKTKPMPEFPPTRPRLLLISNDIVDQKMAGPGMRYSEMARSLSAQLEVTLAIPGETSLEIPGVRLAPYSLAHPQGLRQLAEEHDVTLASSFILEKFPFLQSASPRLVIDLYDPFVLENLYYYEKEPLSIQENLNTHSVSLTNQLAQSGDFFICGNERQRDYWLGVLTANGRANPRIFAQDNTLLSLIDIVGVGIPELPPQARPLLRGVHPQVPAQARIVLWGGGMWDWLDPLTLVRAWPKVLAAHPEARLVFLGMRHPNPLVPAHAMPGRVEALAAEIGEKDRSILFFDWLSYTDREALLAEADIGAMLHPVHVETRFSIRTRVLDYLWARLPILITQGDVTSEWVLQHGVGRVIPPFDEAAAAAALCELLDQPKQAFSAAFDALQAQHRWSRAVQPLLNYCLHGAPAADRGTRKTHPGLPGGGQAWRWRISRAWFILRSEGLSALLHRLGRYIQWRILR